MKTSRKVSLSVVSALILLQLACGDSLGPAGEPGNQEERISITNDETELSGRVQYRDDDVPVDSITGESQAMATAAKSSGSARGFSLRLVAEVGITLRKSRWDNDLVTASERRVSLGVYDVPKYCYPLGLR